MKKPGKVSRCEKQRACIMRMSTRSLPFCFLVLWGQADPQFRATVQVIADEDSQGSALILAVSSDWASPTVSLWKLCFTWLKAVVLRQPLDAYVSGSYVCLPSQEEPLQPGGLRAFMIEIGPPSMRCVSDLPKGLHIVSLAAQGSPETLYDVELVMPGESQVRLAKDAPASLFQGVPQPETVTALPGQGFGLDAGLQSPVKIEAAEEAKGAAALLQSWLLTWPPGAPFGVPEGTTPGDARTLYLVWTQDEGLGKEGYEVRIQNNAITVIANAPAGFLHGAATLRQLLSVALAEGWNGVPAQMIRDRPRFKHRGLMLDVGRHFFSLDFIQRLLDWMFLYKFNVFHWHLTDDEGWRFEVRSLPNLTRYGAWRGRGEVIEPQYGGGPHRYGGFYTQAQIREVVRYAEARGITVIPEIDVPGHCYAAIQALPELLGSSVKRREKPVSVQGFRGNVLNPAADSTYVFLRAVLTEVLELFPGPVHVGMDEIPRGAWSDSADEEEELKAHLILWLQQFLAERGRPMMAWEEAFSTGAAVDPDALQRPVAFAWKEDERFAAHAANAGLDIVLCPAHFLYLDIVQSLAFEERGLYWAAPALPLQRVYDYEPIERLKRLGLQEEAVKRVRGLQANLWTETVDSEARAEEMLFPRLLAVAELAWTQRREWENFKWKIGPQLLWLSREGLKHWNQICGQIARGDFLRVAPAL